MNIISIVEAALAISALLLALDYFDSIDKRRQSGIEKIWNKIRKR